MCSNKMMEGRAPEQQAFISFYKQIFVWILSTVPSMKAETGSGSSVLTTTSGPRVPLGKCLLTEHKPVKVNWEPSGLEGRLPLPSCENIIKLHNHVPLSFHISKLSLRLTGANKRPWKQKITELIFSEKQVKYFILRYFFSVWIIAEKQGIINCYID